MRFDVVTVFPEYFDSIRVGLLGKAIDNGIIRLGIWDLRRWAPEPHKKVDDEPFGGGAGMVMSAPPIVEAVEELREPGAVVVILSPRGERLTQEKVKELSIFPQVILVCGRYEGIDERVSVLLEATEVSIGDYVLGGGEPAAAVVLEAVARLAPGFVGNAESLSEESFATGILEYAQYTRPQRYRGAEVPEVLISGDHGRIHRWRRESALRKTFEVRPDLLVAAELTEEEKALLAEWRSE